MIVRQPQMYIIVVGSCCPWTGSIFTHVYAHAHTKSKHTKEKNITKPHSLPIAKLEVDDRKSSADTAAFVPATSMPSTCASHGFHFV